METELAVKKTTYKTTEEMRYLAARYLTLEEYTDTAFKGKWFTPVSIMEKLEYIDRLANAKQAFWEEVYNYYPELIGESVVFCGNCLFVKD